MAVADATPQALLLVTVNVRVMVFPSSPSTAEYVGVIVVSFDKDPKPLCVHNTVPLEKDAPLTVAVSKEQIVWLPPDEAVGNGSSVTVTPIGTPVHPFALGVIV